MRCWSGGSCTCCRSLASSRTRCAGRAERGGPYGVGEAIRRRPRDAVLRNTCEGCLVGLDVVGEVERANSLEPPAGEALPQLGVGEQTLQPTRQCCDVPCGNQQSARTILEVFADSR